jgi:hypothetical protein
VAKQLHEVFFHSDQVEEVRYVRRFELDENVDAEPRSPERRVPRRTGALSRSGEGVMSARAEATTARPAASEAAAAGARATVASVVVAAGRYGGQAEPFDLGGGLLRGEGLAPGELDLPVHRVDGDDLDLDLVAHLDDVGRLADAAGSQLGDVDEAVGRSFEATVTVPSSCTSILQEYSFWSARIVLPPEPMTSRILSSGTTIVRSLGANSDSSGRAAWSVASILSRRNIRPRRAWSRAAAKISREMPESIIARDPPQIVAIDDDPFDSRMVWRRSSLNV